MKLSSLNKFKGKIVRITETDNEGEERWVRGLVDDIEEDRITIATDRSLSVVLIKDIISIVELDRNGKIK